MPMPILIAGGVAAAGLAAIALLGDAPTPPSTPLPAPGWIDRVIARVSEHEGGFTAMNKNLDGAGLSVGILQWAQKPGNLGKLLTAMHRADPERFMRTFGPAWPHLLATTARGSLAPVDGAVLWRQPWLGRFQAALADPAFQRVQLDLARQGEHFQGALAVARRLFGGLATERAVALFFDTSVQQGPKGAMRVAERVLRQYPGQRIPYETLLHAYAQAAAAKFRRTTPPTEPYPSSHIEWRLTNGEWHAWAGRWDLFADILRRRMGIVSDRRLSDNPLPLPGGAA